MDAVQFLKKQMNLVNATLHLMVEPLSDEQWTERSLPGFNLVSFTSWHLVRVLDAEVHTVCRGVPEVASASPWSSIPALAHPGVGIGLSLEEADALGRSLSRSDLLGYADAVRSSVNDWLGDLDRAELDRSPDFAANLARGPEVYRGEAYANVFPLGPPLNLRPDKPLWLVLAAPCLLHPSQHFGEIEILAQAQERQGPGGRRRATGLAMA